MFSNRVEAATALAQRLAAYRGRNPLVLAIPRGAVPMAEVIARALGGEADVVLVRKLRAPHQPELAIGAIDETGHAYLTAYAAEVGGSTRYIEDEKQAQLETMRKRRALYTPARAPRDPAGRIAIVVDDGLATGSTMIAALRAVRRAGPQRLVCAVPVSSSEALESVTALADEVVCLEVPPWLGAISQFYAAFPQVSDEEVIEILKRCGGAAARATAPA
jgi:predicted phosphoribosyltransferase